MPQNMERDRAAIDACDAVVALLDGVQVDDGIAWEKRRRLLTRPSIVPLGLSPGESCVSLAHGYGRR